MATKKFPLGECFTEDHRHMTRGFWKLRNSLEAEDLETAIELAHEIDRRVGPHIEFEETVFYPELRKVFGDEFVDRLYREHEVGRALILELLSMDEHAGLPKPRLAEMAQRADKSLEHAVSCGTLLSHMEALDESRQRELLAKLRNIRIRGTPWSKHVPPLRHQGQ
jgi:hypothetical protein